MIGEVETHNLQVIAFSTKKEACLMAICRYLPSVLASLIGRHCLEFLVIQ